METFLLNLLNGVGQINFQIAWKLVALVFVAFWVVVLDWVWTDSGERTTNRRTRVIYVLLVLFLNVFGWIIYLIIRPSQTIEQIYWADLERRYLKYETAELGDCVKCGAQLYPGYTFCPKCGLEIKMKCQACDMYIEKDSEYCPFCGMKVKSEFTVEEQAPSKEVMEQQILASKEEAAKVVESEQTRYSTKKRSLTVKLGAYLIHGYEMFLGKLKKKSTEEQAPKVDTVVVSSKKNGKKKKKNKKH